MTHILSTRFTRLLLISCLVGAVILQGPAGLAVKRSSAAPIPQGTASTSADGYLVVLKSTADVNAFLSSNPIRQQYLDSLTARGLNPDAVGYISVSSDPLVGSDDLTQLTGFLNTNLVQPSGGTPLTGVEVWLGAYQNPDSSLEADFLLVANAEDGSQKVLNWVQADANALAGSSTPISGSGDFYGGSAPAPATTAAVSGELSGTPTEIKRVAAIDVGQLLAIGARFLLCWIACYFLAYAAYLLCIVQAIRDCIFTFPPSLSCLARRLALCRLAFLLTVIVFCTIFCLQQALGAVVPRNDSTQIGAGGAVLLNRGQRDQLPVDRVGGVRRQ